MINLVLIVDDDEGVRDALRSYLEIEGLMSIEARNGQEALQIIKNKKDINFVISDYRMPTGDGLFLIKELRKLDPILPLIILLSGNAELAREEAITIGASDMFIKPPNMTKVIGVIKNSIYFKQPL